MGVDTKNNFVSDFVEQIFLHVLWITMLVYGNYIGLSCLKLTKTNSTGKESKLWKSFGSTITALHKPLSELAWKC